MNSNQWWRPLTYAVGGLCAGAFVVMLVWMLVSVNQTANRVEKLAADNADTTTKIRDTQKSSRSLLNLINDCIKPEGKCRKESEARDAAQIGAFNAAVIATRYCADGLPRGYTLHELTVCVGEVLDGKGHK
jgi:hypothetical protein